jgi:hypothetical protein
MDTSVMGPPRLGELDLIRRQLDRLVDARADWGFSPAESAQYERLTSRELALLPGP